MKKCFFLFSLVLAFGQVNAQNLQLGWGYTNGSTGADGANDLAIDAAGNTYVTGYFSGTVDFDKGPGTANLSTNGNQTAKDAFILKLDPQGNYVWAKRIGGTNNYDQEGTKIAIDTAGNIVVSGTFYGNVLLPPSSTNYNASFTEPGSFVLKYDTAGTALWARAWANTNSEMVIEDFVIDQNNRIVAVGEFTNTINFSTNATPNTKTSAGGKDFFVMRLAQNGNLMNVERGGNANDDYAHGIIMTVNQYCVLGRFKGTVDFNWSSGTNNLTSLNSTFDCFLLFTNQSLVFQDAKSFGGSLGALGRDIVSVGNSFIYIVGLVAGVADLDPDPQNTWPFNNSDTQPFIIKCDLTGDLIWAKTFSLQAGYVEINGIDIRPNGDAIIIGETSESIDVDPGPGSFILNVTSSIQSYIVTLSSNGSFVNGILFGGPNSESLKGVKSIGNFATRYAGWFRLSFDIDPGPSITTASSAGLEDLIVIDFISCSDTLVNTTETVCGGYTLNNGQVITQSGTYNDTLQTTIGCDSVVARAITINPLPNTALVWQGGTLQLVNGSSINTHQWIDCTTGQAIAGATGTSYTPTGNGSFAVIVSNGTCTDTSTCETLTNFSLAEQLNIPLKIYPNPTTGLLRIESPQPWQQVEVVDLLGNIVHTSTKEEFDLANLPAGMYLVKVYFEEGVVVERVVIK